MIETDGELISNVNERIQMQSVDLLSDHSPILIHKTKLPFGFSSGTPLDPCELLFYACLKLNFKKKHLSPEVMKMSAESLTLFTKENIVLCQFEISFIEQAMELGMALERKR